MGRLRDKVILITGAAGGIGSAIAEAVVRNGGIAVATDVEGRSGIDHPLDVTSEADWQRVIDAIGASAGRLDGLVNSAGIAPMGTVESTDYALCRKAMAINVDGTFLGCKHALPLIKRTGGSIVNISSVSGIVGGHNLAAYNASKGGVRLLQQVGRAAWRAAEPAGALQFGAPDLHRRADVGCAVQHVPQPRRDEGAHGEARSRCGASASPPRSPRCASICSPMNSVFVTGAEFVIDGGLTAQ